MALLLPQPTAIVMKRVQSRQTGYSMIEILVVVALVGIIAVVALPMVGNAMNNFRLSGDARGVSNAISLAKMRAAATFTQARVYADLSTNSYRIEIWDKTALVWKSELGSMYLKSPDTFGYGVVSTAPPNSQATIGQAAPCLDNTAHAIGNTACVLFNSRSVPVDTTGTPTGIDALYLTDGTAIYSTTVSATSMIRLWRTPPAATPTWTLQ